MKAADFNRAAEECYRDDLRKSHFLEGFRFLEEDLRRIGKTATAEDGAVRNAFKALMKEEEASSFIRNVRQDVVNEKASPDLLRKLISLLLLTLLSDRRWADQTFFEDTHQRKEG
jgi:hypothetical protein